MKRKIIPLLLVCALLAGALLWLFVFPADVTRTGLRLLPAQQESAAAAAYYLDRIKSGETDDAHFLYVNDALSWESLRPGDLTVATVSLTANHAKRAVGPGERADRIHPRVGEGARRIRVFRKNRRLYAVSSAAGGRGNAFRRARGASDRRAFQGRLVSDRMGAGPAFGR